MLMLAAFVVVEPGTVPQSFVLPLTPWSRLFVCTRRLKLNAARIRVLKLVSI
jgi:hypothetical protein